MKNLTKYSSLIAAVCSIFMNFEGKAASYVASYDELFMHPNNQNVDFSNISELNTGFYVLDPLTKSITGKVNPQEDKVVVYKGTTVFFMLGKDSRLSETSKEREFFLNTPIKIEFGGKLIMLGYVNSQQQLRSYIIAAQNGNYIKNSENDVLELGGNVCIDNYGKLIKYSVISFTEEGGSFRNFKDFSNNGDIIFNNGTKFASEKGSRVENSGIFWFFGDEPEKQFNVENASFMDINQGRVVFRALSKSPGNSEESSD